MGGLSRNVLRSLVHMRPAQQYKFEDLHAEVMSLLITCRGSPQYFWRPARAYHGLRPMITLGHRQNGGASLMSLNLFEWPIYQPNALKVSLDMFHNTNAISRPRLYSIVTSLIHKAPSHNLSVPQKT